MTLVLRTDGPVDRLRAPVRAAVDDIISSRQLVHARERDIGVRLALGARPWAVMERMLLLGLTPVALGIAAGLLVAVTLVRLLHAYVSPIASTGVDIFLAAAAVILVGTTAAGVAAVARIRHLSPVDILRQD